MNTGLLEIKMIIALCILVPREAGKFIFVLLLNSNSHFSLKCWYADFGFNSFHYCNLPNFIRTPLHCDVYGSFSWSANIVGQKRWIMFPPGEEEKLKKLTGNNSLPNDVSEIDLTSCDARFIDLTQNEGEIIFVPSGWFHQVWNLVISVWYFYIQQTILSDGHLFFVRRKIPYQLITTGSMVRMLKTFSRPL